MPQDTDKPTVVREYFNSAIGRWVVHLSNGRSAYRYRYRLEQHLGRVLSGNEHVHLQHRVEKDEAA